MFEIFDAEISEISPSVRMPFLQRQNMAAVVRSLMRNETFIEPETEHALNIETEVKQ